MIDRKMTSCGSEIGTCSIFNVPPNISKDSRFLDSCHVLLSLVVSFADSALFQLETWQDVQTFFFFSEHPKCFRVGKPMFLAHSIWPVLLKIISIYFPNRLELSFRRVLAFPNAFPIDFFGLLDHGFITKSQPPSFKWPRSHSRWSLF